MRRVSSGVQRRIVARVILAEEQDGGGDQVL